MSWNGPKTLMPKRSSLQIHLLSKDVSIISSYLALECSFENLLPEDFSTDDQNPTFTTSLVNIKTGQTYGTRDNIRIMGSIDDMKLRTSHTDLREIWRGNIKGKRKKFYVVIPRETTDQMEKDNYTHCLEVEFAEDNVWDTEEAPKTETFR